MMAAIQPGRRKEKKLSRCTVTVTMAKNSTALTRSHHRQHRHSRLSHLKKAQLNSPAQPQNSASNPKEPLEAQTWTSRAFYRSWRAWPTTTRSAPRTTCPTPTRRPWRRPSRRPGCSPLVGTTLRSLTSCRTV